MESCLSPSPNGSKCSLGSYEGQSWKEGKARQSQKGRTWMSLSGTMMLLHPCPWSFWLHLPLPIYGESCVWLRRLYAKAVMTYIFKIALHSPQSWAEAITEGGWGVGWGREWGGARMAVSCAFLWSLPGSIWDRKKALLVASDPQQSGDSALLPWGLQCWLPG